MTETSQDKTCRLRLGNKIPHDGWQITIYPVQSIIMSPIDGIFAKPAPLSVPNIGRSSDLQALVVTSACISGSSPDAGSIAQVTFRQLPRRLMQSCFIRRRGQRSGIVHDTSGQLMDISAQVSRVLRSACSRNMDQDRSFSPPRPRPILHWSILQELYLRAVILSAISPVLLLYPSRSARVLIKLRRCGLL